MSEMTDLIVGYLKEYTPAQQEDILQRLATEAVESERRKNRKEQQEKAKQERIQVLSNIVNELGPQIENLYKTGGNLEKILPIAKQHSEACKELKDLQSQ